MITHHDFMRASGRLADEHHDLFGLVPTMTQCGNCYKVIPLHTCHKTKLHITETHVEEDHYCDPGCAEEWWENFKAKDD